MTKAISAQAIIIVGASHSMAQWIISQFIFRIFKIEAKRMLATFPTYAPLLKQYLRAILVLVAI